MRGLRIGLVVGALALSGVAAMAQSSATPTSPNAGPHPGAAATDQVTSPTKPPGEMAPPIRPGATTGEAPPSGRVEYTTPPATGTGDMREMVDLMRAAATAARESVDYQRVVPDILTQILTKLDKLEDKLGKVEAAIEGKGGRKR